MTDANNSCSVCTTANEMDNDNNNDSCCTMYYYYNKIKEGFNQLIAIRDVQQLFTWLQYFEKPKYLAIIHLLDKTGMLHLSHIAKTLKLNPGCVKQNLDFLIQNHIIISVDKKEPEAQKMISILKTQKGKYKGGFTLNHWKQVELYQLTAEAKIFFKDVPYETILNPELYQGIQRKTEELRARKLKFHETAQPMITKDVAVNQIKENLQRQPYLESPTRYIAAQMSLYANKYSVDWGEITPNEVFIQIQNGKEISMGGD